MLTYLPYYSIIMIIIMLYATVHENYQRPKFSTYTAPALCLIDYYNILFMFTFDTKKVSRISDYLFTNIIHTGSF